MTSINPCGRWMKCSISHAIRIAARSMIRQKKQRVGLFPDEARWQSIAEFVGLNQKINSYKTDKYPSHAHAGFNIIKPQNDIQRGPRCMSLHQVEWSNYLMTNASHNWILQNSYMLPIVASVHSCIKSLESRYGGMELSCLTALNNNSMKDNSPWTLLTPHSAPTLQPLYTSLSINDAANSLISSYLSIRQILAIHTPWTSEIV